MKRLSEIFLLSIVQLDERQDEPLYKQLYESLRRAILSGQLQARVRLPSIRDLSTLLNVSRNTVTHALDQLSPVAQVSAQDHHLSVGPEGTREQAQAVQLL